MLKNSFTSLIILVLLNTAVTNLTAAQNASGSPSFTIIWTGFGGSNQWGDPNNWDLGRVPNLSDDVLVSGGEIGTAIVAVHSLYVSHGTLSMINGVHVNITTDFVIDTTGFVSGNFGGMSIGGNVVINGQFESLSQSNPTLSCSGNFLQRTSVSFSPGTTSVELHGSDSYASGQFYELNAYGSSMHSQGNIYVAWRFGSTGSIIISPADTLFVQDSDPSAFYTFESVSGTISRAIAQGNTEVYDFDNVATYLKFNGTGTYPASVVIDNRPNESPVICGEQWIPVASTLDTSANTISTDNVHNFSKWAIGIMYPGSAVPAVKRTFVISASGGGPFTCKLSLHYESSEVPPGTPEDSLVILRSDAISTRDNISLGWNLLSIPNKRVTCNLKSDFFPSATSNAFKFNLNSGTYTAADTLVSGLGYWLKFPVETQYPISGIEATQETISVSPGWNMIGSLSNDLQVSSIATVPPGLIAGPFFEYDGGYLASPILKPTRGYWVQIASPGGKLILHTSASAEAPSSVRSTFPDLSTITIYNSSGRSQTLYFGKESGQTDFKTFSLPPPPPPGGFDARFSTQKMAELFHRDTKELTVLLSSGEFPVTVHWNIRIEDEKYLLVTTDKTILISGKGSAEVLSHTFTLRLIENKGALLPEKFALEQNYPNPFNPATVIRYQLPVASRVTLRVYDILGQVVSTLVEGVRTAGYQSATFDAGSLASGIYFFKLEAAGIADSRTSFVEVKKMMVVR